MTDSVVLDGVGGPNDWRRETQPGGARADGGRLDGAAARVQRARPGIVDAGCGEGPPAVRPLGRMPVAIPDDIADRSLLKASGVVTLPEHIAWSPPYSYDLEDRRELCCVYARVMTEGLEADVRYYIDIDVLAQVWEELYLSPHVRERWGTWLTQRDLIP